MIVILVNHDCIRCICGTFWVSVEHFGYLWNILGKELCASVCAGVGACVFTGDIVNVTV